jgi:LEA14-like dessication related protein
VKKPGKVVLRIIFILVFLFIGVSILLWYISRKNETYPTFFKPRIELIHYKVKKLTHDSIDMDMELLINNPLPIGIKMDSLRYKIYIGGVEVIKSKHPKSIVLRGNESSSITLPVIIKKEQLTGTLKKLQNKNIDSTEYKISGSADVSILIFKNHSYHFNYSKILPVFVIPRVKVVNYKIEKLGLKHSRLLLNVQIENDNGFPYAFKETSYNIEMDHDHLASGKIDSTINVIANGRTMVNIPVDLSLAEALETKYDSWFHSSTTKYYVLFKAKIVSENNSIEDSRLIMEAKGTLKDLKE